MCEMGTENITSTTSTSQPQLDFSPEQLAAQGIGLRTIQDTMPAQTLQRLRAMSLLRSLSSQPDRGNQQAVAAPINLAGRLVRNALGVGLGQVGLQPSSYAPMLDRLRSVDRQSFNAARNAVTDEYLKGSPIPLYRPDLGRYAIEPRSAKNITTTTSDVESQAGTGAQLLQALGTMAGIAASYYGRA